MAGIWHEVPGYRGWYEVSNDGRVRSWRLKGNPSVRAPRPHELAQATAPDGRTFVGLALDGHVFQVRVNRLVLLTYIGEPQPGARAVHLNNDPADNRLENLQWGTAAQQARLAGERAKRAKLTWANVREMRRLHASGEFTFKQLAARYRVSDGTAWRAVKGYSWKEK